MNRSIVILMFLSVFASLVLSSCDQETPDAAIATFVDLVPVAEGNGPTSFCIQKTLDGHNYFVVTVKNKGNVKTLSTTITKVKFEHQTYPLETPILQAGEEVELLFELPWPGCGTGDCHFSITVDSDNDIFEDFGGENNNEMVDLCIG